MLLKIKMRSYIANPYWAELNEVIDIQKRCWSPRMKEATRAASLAAYLVKNGITTEYYDALIKKTKEQWYKNKEGKIIIPRHQLGGCLVHTVKRAPKPLRSMFNSNSFRALVQLTDLVTDKTDKDEVFSRYVKSDQTNQRRLTVNESINDFEAQCTITLDETIEQEDFLRLLSYGLSRIGLGSCRPMGYGRGEILSPKVDRINFKELESKKDKAKDEEEEESESPIRTRVLVEEIDNDL